MRCHPLRRLAGLSSTISNASSLRNNRYGQRSLAGLLARKAQSRSRAVCVSLRKNATSRTTPSEIDVQHRVVKLEARGISAILWEHLSPSPGNLSQLSGRFRKAPLVWSNKDLHVRKASGEGTDEDLVFQARGCWQDDVRHRHAPPLTP